MRSPRIKLAILIILFFHSISFAFSQAPGLYSGASSTKEGFSFVAFGDNRDGDDHFMALIDKVNMDESLDFCVNTGDFVSRSDKNLYENYLQMTSELTYPVYNVAGNHDVNPGGYSLYKKHFGPSYYSFEHKNAHFVILDNALANSFDYKQFDWLKKDLEKNKKENVFVFLHKPLFDPTEIYKNHVMSGRETAKRLIEVFEKYKVDYVIAGHIHGYARAERNGVVYVVTGGAGAPLYLPREFGGFFHYVKITVAENNIYDKVVRFYE